MILADYVVEFITQVLIRGFSLLCHAMRPAIVIEAMAIKLLLMRDIWDDDCQLVLVCPLLETTMGQHGLCTILTILPWDKVHQRVEVFFIWCIKVEEDMTFSEVAPVREGL